MEPLEEPDLEAGSTLPRRCVVQRCRCYGLWPENSYVESNPFSIPGLKFPLLQNAKFRVGVRSYQNRKRFDEAAQDISGDVFKFIGHDGQGYRVGDTIYVEGAGHGFLELKFLGPVQGEVDIYISVEDGENVSPEDLYECLSPYMPSLVFHVSTLTRDWLVPTWPVIAVIRDGHASVISEGRTSSSVKLAVVARHRIMPADVGSAVGHFAHLLATTSAEDRITIDKAAQRIETASKELDPIDQYCDYWEACEFITKARKYKVDYRIVNRLQEITGFNKKILADQIVGPLYDIRCDVVHNAVERMDRVQRALPILQDIAVILRAAAVGGVYSPIGVLAEHYQAVCEGRAVAL